MTIWHQFLACAFVVACSARGKAEVKVDSDCSNINTNEVNLESAYENYNERGLGHLTGENYQVDEKTEAKAIPQLRWKRENSPPYNREHSEYLEKANTAAERKMPSRNEGNFIQVPNKGGILENIKKEHLSTYNQEGKSVQYNSDGESFDSGNKKRGYESVLDPSSGYHIISEGEKYFNGELKEEHEEIAMPKKNADSDDYRAKDGDIKNLNISTQSNQGRQTSPNVDIKIEELRYTAQKKPLIHLVTPNPSRRIEPVVESSGLKDTVSHVETDYVRQIESIPEGNSYAYKSVKSNQMLLPRQTKDQELNSYQQHEPSNFDRRLVNLETENIDSSEHRYIEGEYVPHEESIRFENEEEYKNPQGGHAEKEKFVNLALEHADQQSLSQNYRTKPHLTKESIDLNENEERTTSSHAAQPLQSQNWKYNSQQMQYNTKEDDSQLQNNGYEQVNVPIITSYHQTDDKIEEKIPIHNLDYIPQQVHKYSSNQGNDAETQKQPTTSLGYYEQLSHNYDQKLLLPSKTPENQNREQSSHIVPQEGFVEVNDGTNFPYGDTRIGNKHNEDYNLPPFHRSLSLDYSPKNAQLEKEDIYDSDANKRATVPISFSLHEPPNKQLYNI